MSCEPESKGGEKLPQVSSCLLWGENALLSSSSLPPGAPGDPQGPLPAALPHFPSSRCLPAVPEQG